jgi:hypothetical protein
MRFEPNPRRDGWLALIVTVALASCGDDPRLLEVTLAGGADVAAKDRFNGTGLIRAAERGYARIVRLLLRTDIDVDHVNRPAGRRCSRQSSSARAAAPTPPRSARWSARGPT